MNNTVRIGVICLYKFGSMNAETRGEAWRSCVVGRTRLSLLRQHKPSPRQNMPTGLPRGTAQHGHACTHFLVRYGLLSR